MWKSLPLVCPVCVHVHTSTCTGNGPERVRVAVSTWMRTCMCVFTGCAPLHPVCSQGPGKSPPCPFSSQSTGLSQALPTHQTPGRVLGVWGCSQLRRGHQEFHQQAEDTHTHTRVPLASRRHAYTHTHTSFTNKQRRHTHTGIPPASRGNTHTYTKEFHQQAEDTHTHTRCVQSDSNDRLPQPGCCYRSHKGSYKS